MSPQKAATFGLDLPPLTRDIFDFLNETHAVIESRYIRRGSKQADAYLVCGKLLIENRPTHLRFDAPIYFLLFHAAELYLKSVKMGVRGGGSALG
jgi:hypothetical protein